MAAKLIGIPEQMLSDIPGWVDYFGLVADTANSLRQSGTTAQRPTKNLWNGRPYFDETLGKPIWYYNTGWVDATGSSA